MITGASCEKLLGSCKRILTYATAENKRDVKVLMSQYSALINPSDGKMSTLSYKMLYFSDQVVIFALAIAASLTVQRGKSKQALFITFKVSIIQGKLLLLFPYLIGTVY